MTQREMLLGLIVLLFVGAFGAHWLFSRYGESLEQSRTALAAARAELETAQQVMAQGELDSERLEAWQEKSLPNERDVARSLYRSWLLDRAKEAGLAVADITANERTPTRPPAYRSIGYTIEASGRLSAVASFLHAFYRIDALHQITRLNLISTAASPELKVSIDVEALMLPEATHTSSMPQAEADRLRLASLDEYKKSLDERNIFLVYTPPRPPAPAVVERSDPPPPAFDHAEYAHFNSTVGNPGNLQAWINVRTTGESFRLWEGDSIKVGSLEGEIVRIEPHWLILQTSGKQVRVKLGDSLRNGTEIDSGDAAADPAHVEAGS